MSEITLEAIAKTVEEVVKQELDPIKTHLDNIEKTQSIHTSSLAQLLTEKNLRDEKIINAHRFDRLEKWDLKAGEKIGLKLGL